MGGDKRAAALAYAERGWSVIPVVPGTKRPCVPWERFAKERPTTAQIMAWWQKWPDAEVAVVTGAVSGLVVVDVDVHRGGNPKPAFSACPTGLISVTGGGGYHLFYSHPGGVVGNAVGKDGIDIRGDGGYVLVPPSSHPSGSTYQWMKEGVPGDGSKVMRPMLGVETEEKRPEWFKALWGGVGKGLRNDACARLTGYFAGKRMAPGIVFSMLVEWNARNQPPLSRDEIVATVRSVYRVDRRTSRQSYKVDASSAPPVNFNVINLSEFMTRFGTTPVSWVINDWLPEQTVAFVIAPPGTYKTWFFLDLAASVASGTPFLDQYMPLSTGPVLIIQQEDFHGQTAERLATILQQRLRWKLADDPENISFDAPPDIPIYFHVDRELSLDDASSMLGLQRRIAEIRPKLVLIDPLYSIASTDDYMAKAARQLLEFKRMRDRYGCSFVIAHHANKSGNAESVGSRETAWGSQFLNAVLETGWHVRAVPGRDGVVTVKRHFKVRGSLPDLEVSFEINTEPPYIYKVGTGELEDVNLEQDLNNVLLGALQQDPLSASDLVKYSRKPKREVQGRLEALEADGVITRGGDKKYRIARQQ